MACWIDVELPDGVRGAGLSDHAGPWIVLHLNALALPDEQLGRLARMCGKAAQEAEAACCADWVTGSNRGRKPWDIRDEVLETEPILLPYAGCSHLIDEALAIIEQARIYRQNKAVKPQKRQEVHNNYDHLLVKIGRRDGFHCHDCRSTTDLQIDHINPLALGGTNDLDNLQLLCRICNVKKGATAPTP